MSENSIRINPHYYACIHKDEHYIQEKKKNIHTSTIGRRKESTIKMKYYQSIRGVISITHVTLRVVCAAAVEYFTQIYIKSFGNIYQERSVI